MTQYTFSKMNISKGRCSIEVYTHPTQKHKFHKGTIYSERLKISEILKNLNSECGISVEEIFALEEEYFEASLEDIVFFLKELNEDSVLLDDFHLDDLDLDNLDECKLRIRSVINFLEKNGNKTVWKTEIEGFDDYLHYCRTREEAIDHACDYICGYVF